MGRIICLFALWGSGFLAQAQHYQYKLLPGWKADQIFQLSEGGFDVIGLGALNFKHYVLVNRMDVNLQVAVSQKYTNPNQLSETSHLWYKVDVFKSHYYLNTFYDSSNISKVGVLLAVDVDSLKFTEKRIIQLGRRSFPSQAFFGNDSNYLIFGVTVTDTITKDFKSKVFLLKILNDSVLAPIIYGCNSFSQNGGCELVLRQALKLDDGFILVCESRAFQYRDALIDPLLIRIDSNGKEIWRRNLGNPTTSGLNVLVAPLANGNFLATYVDHYWKPFKDPDGGPNQDWPTPKRDASLWFAEVTPEGKIDSVWDIKEVIKFVGNSYEFAYCNHLIQARDSSIIITGSVKDQGDKGLLLKLDKNGKYQWLRHIELNINGGNGTEELYLYGVTELKQGGYALSGEYRSQPSDSFPNGNQQAVVLFVDENGCFEPGCHLKDGIPSLANGKSLEVQLYPNPSSGLFTFELGISLANETVSYLVYDALGRQVSTGNARNCTTLLLENSGLYFVYIRSNKGVAMVKCVKTE